MDQEDPTDETEDEKIRSIQTLYNTGQKQTVIQSSTNDSVSITSHDNPPIPPHEPQVRNRNNRRQNRVSPEVQQKIDQIAHFYDNLLTRTDNRRNECRYFWQWKLSKDEYDSLQGILKNCNFLQDCARNNYKCAKALALYIAEWYKRECRTLDGDHALEGIELQRRAQQVWEYARIPSELLHHAGENNNTMAQNALCVLGGFPLQYVLGNPERFHRLFVTLIHASRENEFDNDDLNALAAVFDNNNTVFKSSLHNGSCRDYLLSLVNYLNTQRDVDLPFSIDDMDMYPFKEFKERLDNEWEDKVRNGFFSPIVYVYTDNSNAMECQFYLQVGFKKNQNVITEKELHLLGVQDTATIQRFSLRLQMTYANGTVEQSKTVHHYVKIGCGCNDYNGCDGSYLCDKINLFSVRSIKIVFEADNGYTTTFQSELFPESLIEYNYLELYKTGAPYEWSSQKNTSAIKAVLLDSYTYPDLDASLNVADKFDEYSNSDDLTLSMVHQENTLTVLNREGQEITIPFVESEKLIVSFNTSRLTSVMTLTNGCVSAHFWDEDRTLLPLVFGAIDGNNFYNILVRIASDNHPLGIRPTTPVRYEFKQNDRFVTWDDQSQPEQGIVKLRVTCNAHQWMDYIYFVPTTSNRVLPVERDLNNRIIRFHAHDVINLPAKTIVPDSGYSDTVIDIHSLDGHPVDTIGFRVGTEDEYAIFEVFRAVRIRELYNGEKPVKSFSTNDPIQIPILMQKYYKVHCIDENGAKMTDFENNPLGNQGLDYLSDPRILFQSGRGNVINLCVYSKERIIVPEHPNELKYCLNKRYRDNYHFFFWDGIINHQPTEIIFNDEEIDADHVAIIADCSNYKCPKGIIFQSLRDNKWKPNHYSRPYYTYTNSPFFNYNWDFYSSLFGACSLDEIIFCYKIACEHNIYFTIFHCFSKLAKTPSLWLDFLDKILNENNYKLNKKQRGYLRNLAIQLGIDWMLIPRMDVHDHARTLTAEQKQKYFESLRELFKSSPILKKPEDGILHEEFYFKRVFDWYFSPDDRIDTTRRRRDEARYLMECFNGCNQDIPVQRTIDINRRNNIKAFLSDVTSISNPVYIFRDIYNKYIARQ